MVLPFAFFVGVIDNAVPPVNMNYSCGGCIVKGAHLRLLGSDWPTGREARRQWGTRGRSYWYPGSLWGSDKLALREQGTAAGRSRWSGWLCPPGRFLSLGLLTPGTRGEEAVGGGGGHSARVNILGSVHQAGGQRGAKAPRHSAPLADFGFRPHYRYEAWTETEAINGHPNGDMNGFLLGCRLT